MSLFDILVALEPHGEFLKADLKFGGLFFWGWVVFAGRSEHFENKWLEVQKVRYNK